MLYVWTWFLASSSVAYGLSSASQNAQLACAALTKILGGVKVQSNTTGAQYQAAAKGAWNLFNQLDEPTCIVLPTQTSDVTTAMKAIFYAKANYAVQGGGHSAMAGWNTVSDGVLIDFTNMKAFSYNSQTDTITIQPGAHWGDIIDGLAPQGVAAVGGRVPSVGASGFLLGGGLSFLSPAYGYGCDNFRALDVVLPSGQLVTATRTNLYSDLFRALKGGGSRFGIVTRYEVQAIHTGTALDKTWYGGNVVYAASSIVAAVEATDDFVGKNTDPNAVILPTFSYENLGSGFTPLPLVVLLYNGTEAQFNATFATFLALPSLESILGPQSYDDINKLLTDPTPPVHGHEYSASTLLPGTGTFLQAYTHFVNFSTTFQNDLFSTTIAFTPVRQHQIDVSNANGGTAFSSPSTPFAYVQLDVGFPTGVTTISNDIQAGIDLLVSQIPRAAGLPLYLNESNKKQNALTTYNWFQQLRFVYEKYDPTRFSVNYQVGPNGL